MEPTVAAGDWLLVDPLAYVERPPDVDDLVLAEDPRASGLVLIKRVVSIDPDGWLRLEGDDPMRSTDSRVFGAVDPRSVSGAPWFRYWPPRRIGRIDGGRRHRHGSGQRPGPGEQEHDDGRPRPAR